MKKQLLFFTISAAALVASADSIAMMRGGARPTAPRVAISMPKVQKELRRSLSTAKNQQSNYKPRYGYTHMDDCMEYSRYASQLNYLKTFVLQADLWEGSREEKEYYAHYCKDIKRVVDLETVMNARFYAGAAVNFKKYVNLVNKAGALREAQTILIKQNQQVKEKSLMKELALKEKPIRVELEDMVKEHTQRLKVRDDIQ